MLTRYLRVFVFSCLCAATGACGQIGPLYLPEPVEQSESIEEETEENKADGGSQP